MKTELNFLFLGLLFILNSCCLGAKEEYLGNNLYLSEYDNKDRIIIYQEESCSVTGVEIIPMTILEIAHNSKWIIAKSGNKRKQTNFKYWLIKNNYPKTPNPETVKANTFEFKDYNLFNSRLIKKGINLKLQKID